MAMPKDTQWRKLSKVVPRFARSAFRVHRRPSSGVDRFERFLYSSRFVPTSVVLLCVLALVYLILVRVGAIVVVLARYEFFARLAGPVVGQGITSAIGKWAF